MSAPAASPADLATDVLTVPARGLDCAVCAESLAADLRALPGVRAASVSFGAGNARVDFDPALLDRQGVIARIGALGYTVPVPPAEPLRFRVAGMDCAECAKSVERAVAALPGVADARVNFGSATLVVTPAPGVVIPAVEIAARVSGAGYRATADGPRGPETIVAPPWWRERRSLLLAAAIILALAGVVVAVAVGERSAIPLYAGGILLAGWPFARSVWQALRVRRLDMNVLMAASAIGAALLGQWSEGAAVVVLFALGGALQARTLERTRSAIRDLVALAPVTAARINSAGNESRVPIKALEIGDLVRVRPGERLPADGVVVEGVSAVDQSPVTGESMPADKAPGDACFAGTMNGAGSLLLRVSRAAGDSTLDRVIHLVEEAQGSRAPAQQRVDRFAAVYTPAVIAGALLLALAGSMLTGDPRVWISRALTLLVIACPCALVISTPVSIVSAIGDAARHPDQRWGGAGGGGERARRRPRQDRDAHAWRAGRGRDRAAVWHRHRGG